MENNINQIYATFYALLYKKKIELEKERIDLSSWKSNRERLKHIKLDELQCLLECFHDKKPMLFSFLEVISDFRLIEEIFQYKVTAGHFPKELLKKEAVLKLSVKERIQFLNWYLKQHHKFFKNSQNIEMYRIVDHYILERNRMFGITDSDFKRKKEPVSFVKDFYQKQQDSMTVMKYFGNHNEEDRMNADQILKNWHISKRYRDLLLQPQEKEKNTFLTTTPSFTPNKNSDSINQKEKLRRLHELWDGKQIIRFLKEEELVLLNHLFVYCYGPDLGKTLFRTAVFQNNQLLEQMKQKALRAYLSIEEEEQYVNMTHLALDSKCMIPYYYEIIKKSQQEIQDILEEMVFETSTSNYETYGLLIQEEFFKMKEAYSSLYVNGVINHKRELE